MNTALIFVTSWALAGTTFWFACYRFNGWPTRWRARHSRDTGWNEALGIYLPVFLVGGPLWWIAFVTYRGYLRLLGIKR